VKADIIDKIYGQDFIGAPVEANKAWPRFDAMLRNGQYVTGVPRAYDLARKLVETAAPSDAPNIDEIISMVCFPYDRNDRIAALKAAIGAETAR